MLWVFLGKLYLWKLHVFRCEFHGSKRLLVLLKPVYSDPNRQEKIPNNKFIRSFENRAINIRNDLYTLIVSENKRKLIYVNNKFSNTEPYVINNNKFITNI